MDKKLAVGKGIGRRLLACLAAGVVLAPAGTANAAATVTRIYEESTFKAPATDDCRGIEGTVSGTEVLRGQVVETTAGGFHFHGTDTTVLRFEFADGSYGTGRAVDHLSFNSAPGQSNVTVFTKAHLDTLTLFTAEGNLVERLMFHEITHFTLQEGVRVSFEKGHFSLTC